MPRIKTVYSKGLEHEWAQWDTLEQQRYITNPRRTLYVEDGVMYSYGRHYPLARHVWHGGKHAVLINDTGYSTTNRGHISAVARASRQHTQLMVESSSLLRCAYEEFPAGLAQSSFHKEIAPELKKLDNPKTRSTHKAVKEIANWYEDRVMPFYEFFDQPIPEELVGVYLLIDNKDIKARAKRDEIASDKISKALREANSIQSIKLTNRNIHWKLSWKASELYRLLPDKKRKEVRDFYAQSSGDAEATVTFLTELHGAYTKNDVRDWKSGKLRLPNWMQYEEFQWLRKSGNRVQTSMNVEIPYTWAKQLFFCLHKHWLVEELEPHREGVSEANAEAIARCVSRINYPLKVITANWLTIGCHKLKREEIFSFAEEQGWDKEVENNG